ncbi:MAG: exopolysaccharide biosynthesis polyprenyl glycosylphosphotransferase [Terriglobia bacterium]
MLSVRARLTNLFLTTADSLLLLVVLKLIYCLGLPSGQDLSSFLTLIPLVPLSLLFFRHFDVYHSRRTDSCYADLGSLGKSFVLSTTSLLLIDAWGFTGKNRSTIAWLGLAAFLMLAVSRVVSRCVLRQLRGRGHNKKKLFVVGRAQWNEPFIKELSDHRYFGFEVAATFPSTWRDVDGVTAHDGILACLVSLERICPDEVIIGLPLELATRLPELIQACERLGIQATVTEDLAKALGATGRGYKIGGQKLVNVPAYPTERFDYLILKRSFDLVISSLLLLVLMPLLLAIACGVRLSSKGPALFRQQRVGLKGKVFWMFKFRTMTHVEALVSDTEWVPQSSGRYTPLGKLLRRTSLDELPQLFNVILGQMSLVGPRPERPFYTERFKNEVPGYLLRHYIQCGMTGWAQINGWRGNTSIQRRLEHDLYYLKNWGFGLDLKILVLTLFGGLNHRQATPG